MLISKELENAINEQIGAEFGANLQYVSIASYFDGDDLPQLAAFFYRQAEEENMHAMKFVHYLVDAGGQVRIPTIPDTRHEFKSAEHCAQLALEWETEVTDMINDLMEQAIEDNDHISQDFLRWYVSEQLEELNTMETLLNTIRRAGDNILMVEEFLARNPIVEEGHGTEAE